ncbi:MAG: polyhydroxyalkanoate synthesis regulator DNA-binding domain-containing protein [Desulfovermiculus sp.]|nr:polyhydroxyalkanoate synthesis regulator DNA-binding domain-containing protein [Desulfovermiculus sp.]
MSETVSLKKYANRRLYDLDQSAYVTLDQVAGMVKEGKQIQVVDAKSKENVTAFILTQIVMEESRKQALLPASLLHLIIRYGDNLLREFFENYLEETLKIFVNSKIAYDHYFRQWLKMGMNFSEAGQNTDQLPMPFMQMMNMWSSTSQQDESDVDDKNQSTSSKDKS